MATQCWREPGKLMKDSNPREARPNELGNAGDGVMWRKKASASGSGRNQKSASTGLLRDFYSAIDRLPGICAPLDEEGVAGKRIQCVVSVNDVATKAQVAIGIVSEQNSYELVNCKALFLPDVPKDVQQHLAPACVLGEMQLCDKETIQGLIIQDTISDITVLIPWHASSPQQLVIARTSRVTIRNCGWQWFISYRRLSPLLVFEIVVLLSHVIVDTYYRLDRVAHRAIARAYSGIISTVFLLIVIAGIRWIFSCLTQNPVPLMGYFDYLSYTAIVIVFANAIGLTPTSILKGVATVSRFAVAASEAYRERREPRNNTQMHPADTDSADETRVRPEATRSVTAQNTKPEKSDVSSASGKSVPGASSSQTAKVESNGGCGPNADHTPAKENTQVAGDES